MEAASEHERYLANPLRLLRGAVEIGRFIINGEDVPEEIYYERVTIEAEAPVQTEDELLY